MKINNVDYSYVIESAVRACGGDAETYDRARRWMTDFRPTLETWTEAYEPRGLAYRRLVAHLTGKTVDRPAPDNRILSFTIAAGNAWDEIPTRELFYPDDSPDVFFMRDDFGTAYELENATVTGQRATMATIQHWSDANVAG